MSQNTYRKTGNVVLRKLQKSRKAYAKLVRICFEGDIAISQHCYDKLATFNTASLESNLNWFYIMAVILNC